MSGETPPTATRPASSFWAATRFLVAARWKILWNTIRRGARWRQATFLVVGAALAFLSFVSLLVSYGTTLWIVRLTEDKHAADVIASSAFAGVLMLSFLVGFTVALAALYLSADLDLLLASPVSRRAVFFAKLLGGLAPGQGMILAIGLVPLVGHGLAQGYDGWYYAALVLALLVLPILPAAVGAVLVVWIVRRVPAHRLGEIVGLIVVAMTLSIALVAGNSRQLQDAVTVRELLDTLERVRSPFSPAEWLARGLVAAGRHEASVALGWFGLAIAVAAIAVIPLVMVSNQLYYDGWIRMHSANLRKQLSGGLFPWQRPARADRMARPSGVLRWFSPATVAVVRKDLLLIPRDLTNMAQVLSPLAIGAFFIIQQLLYPIRVGGADVSQPFLQPLLAMLSAIVASGIASMITSRFGITGFSFEGKRFWVLQAAPIPRRDLVVAKFLVGYLPFLGLSGALVLLLEAARAVSDARVLPGGVSFGAVLGALDPLLLVYAWLVCAIVGAGVIAISLALGAARPNMRWDSPHEMMTPDVGCISLVLYGAYTAVAVLSLAMPMAFSRMVVLGDARLVLWAAGLVVGLGGTAVVVATSLRLAASEVATIGD